MVGGHTEWPTFTTVDLYRILCKKFTRGTDRPSVPKSKIFLDIKQLLLPPLVGAHQNISVLCPKSFPFCTHPYVKLVLYVPKIWTWINIYVCYNDYWLSCIISSASTRNIIILSKTWWEPKTTTFLPLLISLRLLPAASILRRNIGGAMTSPILSLYCGWIMHFRASDLLSHITTASILCLCLYSNPVCPRLYFSPQRKTKTKLRKKLQRRNFWYKHVEKIEEAIELWQGDIPGMCRYMFLLTSICTALLCIISRWKIYRQSLFWAHFV